MRNHKQAEAGGDRSREAVAGSAKPRRRHAAGGRAFASGTVRIVGEHLVRDRLRLGSGAHRGDHGTAAHSQHGPVAKA
jgi:hypothetical protein